VKAGLGRADFEVVHGVVEHWSGFNHSLCTEFNPNEKRLQKQALTLETEKLWLV
jgi:hypothetical protein